MTSDLSADSNESFDETLAFNAIEKAKLNALRMATYQLTGDPSLAAMKVVKVPLRGGAYYGVGLAEEHSAEVKAKALKFIRDSWGRRWPAAPSKQETYQLMDIFLGGQPWTESRRRLAWEELAFEDFPRNAVWSSPPNPTKLNSWLVLIIGAGMSGIAAAAQMKRLEIPFLLVERQAGIGGTWYLNNYPGARVDTSSYLFQYTFKKRHAWTEFFASQGENRRYLEQIVDGYGIRDHLRLSTTVTDGFWDEDSARWILTLRDAQGQTETLAANFVISASGLFSTPNDHPNIPGIGNFKGKIFHTTCWDHAYDLADKRVAIIGNGSSGVQVMPYIAEKSANLTVFLRHAQWIGPIENYKAKVPKEVHWLMDRYPYYWNWSRFSDVVGVLTYHELQAIDRNWQKKGGIVSERNDRLREHLLQYMRKELNDDADLIAKCTPTHPPMVRRLVVDNGWFKSLLRANVELVAEPIDRFESGGIVTVDANMRHFDAIVLATGFRVSSFLWPVNYVGRNGLTIMDLWSKDGPRAYLGMTVPGFPNFFIFYGPNAQNRGGGSVVSAAEQWSRYAGSLIASVIENDKRTVEVRPDVFDAYGERLDNAMKDLVWLMDGHGYFVNEHGRVITNTPWPPDVAHDMLLSFDIDDYVIA